MQPEAHITLDASGLTCPMPVLKAQKCLRDMASGAVLLLISTDSVSEDEVPLFCEQAGHRLLHRDYRAGQWRFWIARKAQ